MGKDNRQMELLTEADELLTKIEEVEQRCQSSAADVQLRQEELKTAREVYAGAVAELRGLARVRKEEHPLFDAFAATAALPEMANLRSVADKLGATFTVKHANTDNPDAEEPSADGEALVKKIRKMKREEPKWTQEALAATLGISRRQVRKALEAE